SGQTRRPRGVAPTSRELEALGIRRFSSNGAAGAVTPRARAVAYDLHPANHACPTCRSSPMSKVRFSGVAAIVMTLSGAALAGLLAAAASGQPRTPLGADAERAAEAIDATDLERIVAELSSDRYEGRAPGTRGDELTLRFLEQELERLGFEPGMPDGSWRQSFDLVGITASHPEKWSFARGERRVDLSQGRDFIASSGVQRERAAIDAAEVVFVGYGIVAPEHEWNDFKDADLRGKVLLMLNNDPDWDPELFAGPARLYYGRWTYKYESAARQGAAGAIIVHTTPSAGYPWEVVQSSWTGTQDELPAVGEPRVEIEAWVTEAAARRLVAAAGYDLDALVERARRRDFEPIPLGLTTSIALE